MIAKVASIQHEDTAINRIQDLMLDKLNVLLSGAAVPDESWQPLLLAIPCAAYGKNNVPAPSCRRLISGLVCVRGSLAMPSERTVAIGAALVNLPKSVSFEGTRHVPLQYATGTGPTGTSFSAPVALAVKGGQVVLLGVVGVTTIVDDLVSFSLLNLEFSFHP